MSLTQQQLRRLVGLIDLPGYAGVERALDRWFRTLVMIEAVSASIVWTGVIGLLTEWLMGQLLVLAVGILVAGMMLPAYVELVRVNAVQIEKVLSLIGLAGGGIIGLLWNRQAGGVAMMLAGTVGTFLGWLAGLSLSKVAKFLGRLGQWGVLVGLPVALPGKWIALALLQRRLRGGYPAWLDSSGEFIVRLGGVGIDQVCFGTRRLFVSDPKFRSLGSEEKLRFTGAEILGGLNFAQKPFFLTIQPEHDASGMGSPASEIEEPQWINPTTGLPMIGNIAGGIDVGGTPWCQLQAMEAIHDSSDWHPVQHDIASNHDSTDPY